MAKDILRNRHISVKFAKENNNGMVLNCNIVTATLLFSISRKSKAFGNESKTIGEKAERSRIHVKAD